jgi:hypothetical protein
MELYEAVPECCSLIKPLADVPLITKGHVTDEPESDPLVWFSGDGYTVQYYLCPEAVAGSNDREPADPQTATLKDTSVVVRTFEEAIRDCWERRYKMKVEERVIWDALALWTEQETLISDVKGCSEHNEETLRKAQSKVASSIEYACRKFRDICQVLRNR